MSRFYYAYIKLRNDIDSHIADMNNPHKVTASQVPLTDSGGYYSSTDIEGALQEIGSGATLDGRYVLKSGDTMSGPLEIVAYDSTLTMRSTGPSRYGGFNILNENNILVVSLQWGNSSSALPNQCFIGTRVDAPLHLIVNAGGLPTDADKKMTLLSNGNIGLSNVNPDTRLDIGAGAIEMEEITDPGPGVANTARIYSRDDGAGLTELMAVFNTGDPLVLGVQGLTVPTYTLSNVTVTRTLDPTTATVTDVANVLATLIQDLQARRLIKPYI